MTEQTRPSGPLATSDLLLVWQVIADRRTSYDSMMWQTPALGMTAQAFLLTLALAEATSSWARVFSAALSVLISVMVVQLLAKHRRNEMLDTLLLEGLEAQLGLAHRAGVQPHGRQEHRYPQADRDRVDGLNRRLLFLPRPFWRMSSFSLWCFGQYIFGAVGIVIIVFVLTGLGRVFA